MRLVHLFFYTRLSLSLLSSSWCQGLAAACNCGTPRTFLLSFVHTVQVHQNKTRIRIHKVFILKYLKTVKKT